MKTLYYLLAFGFMSVSLFAMEDEKPKKYVPKKFVIEIDDSIFKLVDNFEEIDGDIPIPIPQLDGNFLFTIASQLGDRIVCKSYTKGEYKGRNQCTFYRKKGYGTANYPDDFESLSFDESEADIITPRLKELGWGPELRLGLSKDRRGGYDPICKKDKGPYHFEKSFRKKKTMEYSKDYLNWFKGMIRSFKK